jgi:hypothetical protein
MLFLTLFTQISNIARQIRIALAAISQECWFISVNNNAAYLAELKHITDWNQEYASDCAFDLKNLKSQLKPNSGGCRAK